MAHRDENRGFPLARILPSSHPKSWGRKAELKEPGPSIDQQICLTPIAPSLKASPCHARLGVAVLVQCSSCLLCVLDTEDQVR